MYTEKGSFGISISHLWTDYWIDFAAWPMISFCSDEPGVTAHICIRSYKTGRSLPHIYIHMDHSYTTVTTKLNRDCKMPLQGSL